MPGCYFKWYFFHDFNLQRGKIKRADSRFFKAILQKSLKKFIFSVDVITLLVIANSPTMLQDNKMYFNWLFKQREIYCFFPVVDNQNLFFQQYVNCYF